MFRRSASEGKIAPAVSVVGSAGLRYRMAEGLASIHDDYYVQDDRGQRAYLVKGVKHRRHDPFVLRDLKGDELYSFRQQLERESDSMEIEAPNGLRVAIVQRTMITPLRDRYIVKIRDGEMYPVAGSIVAHEYQIGDVACVSKRWFRVRDSYGVEVAQSQDVALFLAVTVCIDQMTSELG